MANGTEAAVTQASRVDELDFPGFTTDLINGVFDALVSSSLRQMEAYSDLLRAVSQDLTTYIKETKDEIGPEAIVQFLGRILPADEPGELKVAEGAKLQADEKTKLVEAVEVPGETQQALVVDAGVLKDSDGNEVETNVGITQDGLAKILDAVARRIASNKYTLLKEMVRLGLLRLVVTDGVIESRLTFSTTGHSLSDSASSSYSSKSFGVTASVSSGTVLSKWVNVSAKSDYRSLNVSSASKFDRDYSGSSVQIFGRVEIHFKSDYMPAAST